MPKAKYFYIKSKLNGYVLDVNYEKREAGTPVKMFFKLAYKARHQLWIEDHFTGCIRSSLDEDKCLTVSGKNHKMGCSQLVEGMEWCYPPYSCSKLAVWPEAYQRSRVQTLLRSNLGCVASQSFFCESSSDSSSLFWIRIETPSNTVILLGVGDGGSRSYPKLFSHN